MDEPAPPPLVSPRASRILTLAGSAAVLVLLYLVSLSNFLLFHNIIEITTIVIGFSIFVLIFNARKHIDNSYFFVIGIGFFFICIIDFVHTLAYKGMGVFPAATADLPTQLWIAGRYLQAATLLAAPLVIGRKIRLPVLFFGYAAVTALLLGSIWYGIFPPCFIEGQGLTLFKIGSEYLISLLLVLATIALYKKREYFDPPVFRLLVAANILTIGAELAFTAYISVYGFMNMLGHLFRLAATACFCLSFLVIGREQPYELLWYHIRQKEKELEDLNATLADRVAERTRELAEANLHLREEIDYRKHADENLRLADAYNRSLIEASIDPLVTIAQDGKIQDVNSATEKATGLSRSELIGTDFSEYFTEPEKAREGYGRVFAEGKVLDYPLGIRHRDGHITPVLYNATVYHDRDGKVQGVFAAARDISEQKKMEDALRQAAERLSLATRYGEVGIWELDLKKNILIWDDQMFRLYGILPESFGGTYEAWRAGVHPADLPQIETELQEAIRGEREFDTAFRVVWPEGSIHHIHARARVHRDAAGRPTRLIGTNYDITARKLAEEALAELNRYNRSLIEASIDPLVTISKDGKIQDVNTATEQATGMARDELIGTDFSEYFTEPEKAREGYGRVFAEGKVLDYPLEIRHRDGHTIPVLYNATVYHDSGGNVRGVFAAARDITERKQAEDALLRSEEKYRTLFEESFDGLFITSPEGKILDMNRKGISMFGYDTKEEILHLDLERDVYSNPPDRKWILAMVKAQGTAEYEVVVRKKSGEEMITRCALSAVKDERGKITSYRGIIRDISGQKKVEMALMESEALHRSVVTTMAEGVILQATDGEIIAVNPAAEKIEGRTAEQMLGHTSEDPQLGAIHEDGSPFPGQDHPSMVTLRTGEPRSDVVMGIRRPDGTLRWISINSQPLMAPGESRPHAVVTTFHDITGQRWAEAALKKSEEKFRNVFDWANDAILLHPLRIEGFPVLILDANRVACRMLGYSREELLTMSTSDIVPPAFHSQLREISRLGAVTQSAMFETRLLRRDGSTFPVESSGHLVTYEGKKIWISHIRDITGRKEAEEAKERMIHELAQKNAELDRFTYTASHDLKSPLIGIRAYLSLLEDDLKSGDTRQVGTDIARISESAEKLEQMISSLLNLSRSGKSVDTPVQVPTSELVREAAALLEIPLQQRGVRLVIPENLPVVMGDRQRLLQVMTNLLDNAVKFMGDQEEPRVEVGVRPQDGQPAIFVRDNGMGITRENLQKVFGLYERFSPEIPGTGIGLATVKRIIEAHGGRIGVESEGMGKGTTVWFTLPGVTEEKSG